MTHLGKYTLYLKHVPECQEWDACSSTKNFILNAYPPPFTSPCCSLFIDKTGSSCSTVLLKLRGDVRKFLRYFLYFLIMKPKLKLTQGGGLSKLRHDKFASHSPEKGCKNVTFILLTFLCNNFHGSYIYGMIKSISCS